MRRCATTRSRAPATDPRAGSETRKNTRWSSLLRRLVPLQESPCALDGARLQLRRILPGKYRDLRIRAEGGDIDRNAQRMRHDIVGQHQHRGAAGLREIARDAVHEVGLHAV